MVLGLTVHRGGVHQSRNVVVDVDDHQRVAYIRKADNSKNVEACPNGDHNKTHNKITGTMSLAVCGPRRALACARTIRVYAECPSVTVMSGAFANTSV